MPYRFGFVIMQLVLSNYVAQKRRNGVFYESKAYDFSGDVHDHRPDDLCRGSDASAARPDSRHQAWTGKCCYFMASVLCRLEGRPVRAADAHHDCQHGNRTDGVLFL